MNAQDADTLPLPISHFDAPTEGSASAESALTRSLRRIPWVTTAFIAMTVVGAVLLPVRLLATAFAMDDGYYYPRIAMNVVAGYGPTYDLKTVTNGVHPLWQVVLLPLAWIARGDGDLMLRLCFVAAAVMAGAGLWALHLLGRRLRWSRLATGCVIALVCIPRLDLWLCLLETGATLGIVMGALSWMVANDALAAVQWKTNVVFGAWMALVFLVRLDQVFLVVSFFLAAMAIRWQRGKTPWRSLTSTAIAAGTSLAAVAPYLWWNYSRFGHIVPVSGQRKASVVRSADWLRNLAYPLDAVAAKLGINALALATGLCVVGLLLGLWLRATTIQRRTRVRAHAGKWALIAFGVGAVSRAVFLRYYIPESARTPWYWVPEYLVACLAVGYVVDQLVKSSKLLTSAERVFGLRVALAGAISLVAVAYWNADAARSVEDNNIAWDTALWARENLHRGTTCAEVDSGIFSFVSGLPTVGLNGVIGDVSVMEDVVHHRHRELLHRLGVDCLVEYRTPTELQGIPTEAILYRSPGRYQDVFVGAHLVVLDLQKYNPYE